MRAVAILSLMLLSLAANGQLVPCRPKICMIDYNYHNDVVQANNPDLLAIKAAKPDILIDNTPNSYWGQRYNNYTGCSPAQYIPLGIKVFSYIAGGYENTQPPGGDTIVSSLYLNLARIDGIATDGATGVFLDMVSSHPNTAQKAYIVAIYNRCQLRNLKLILNPGIYSFDTSLMSVCDYLLSDEQYNGSRAPSLSEQPFLDRILVVNQGVQTDTSAARISLTARANCFGYSYVCDSYVHVPSYLASYISLISNKKPATPTITSSACVLTSSASCGNQWYGQVQGLITGATSRTFTATVSGTYYSIVTLDGCPSDTSNHITCTAPTGLRELPDKHSPTIFPNPANNTVWIHLPQERKVEVLFRLYNNLGILVISDTLLQQTTKVDLSKCSDGIYFLYLSPPYDEHLQLLIRH